MDRPDRSAQFDHLFIGEDVAARSIAVSAAGNDIRLGVTNRVVDPIASDADIGPMAIDTRLGLNVFGEPFNVEIANEPLSLIHRSIGANTGPAPSTLCKAVALVFGFSLALLGGHLRPPIATRFGSLPALYFSAWPALIADAKMAVFVLWKEFFRGRKGLVAEITAALIWFVSHLRIVLRSYAFRNPMHFEFVARRRGLPSL